MTTCPTCGAELGEGAPCPKCNEAGRAQPTQSGPATTPNIPPARSATLSQLMSYLPEDAPVPVVPRRQHVIILIDASSSMAHEVTLAGAAKSKASIVAEQILTFTAELRRLADGRDDRFHLSIVEFSDTAEVALQLQDVTQMPNTYAVTPAGQTNIAAALEIAVTLVEEAARKLLPSVIVLLSDGAHNVNHPRTPAEIVSEIRRKSIAIQRPGAHPGSLPRKFAVPMFAAALWGGDEAQLRATLGYKEGVVTVRDGADIRKLLIRATTSVQS